MTASWFFDYRRKLQRITKTDWCSVTAWQQGSFVDGENSILIGFLRMQMDLDDEHGCRRLAGVGGGRGLVER